MNREELLELHRTLSLESGYYGGSTIDHLKIYPALGVSTPVRAIFHRMADLLYTLSDRARNDHVLHAKSEIRGMIQAAVMFYVETHDTNLKHRISGEYTTMHVTLCEEARELMRRKNADYAGNAGTEPFANFTRCESVGVCRTEQGFVVRLTDKISRLSSFLEAGEFQVKDESLRDTILDIINYVILLFGYSTDKATENKEI